MRVLTPIACGALLALLGCGHDAPPPRSPSTTSTSVATAPPPEPEPAATAPTPPPAPPAGLTTPEDARRLLEEHGIDPDRLSAEVAEHMQRRFQRPEQTP